MPKYTLEKRTRLFWSRVDKSGGDDACWLWTGDMLKNGYGRMWWAEHMTLAHRISWEIAYDKPPSHLIVCHHCDVRNCVNPAHLFLGTAYDNIHDMMSKGRNHQAQGEHQGQHRLTEQAVIEIRAKRKLGTLMTELAAEYDVDRNTVFAVVHRLSWKHVP